jgi:hypothetical protein
MSVSARSALLREGLRRKEGVFLQGFFGTTALPLLADARVGQDAQVVP